jgi:isopentenyldiphosphate isomerase
LHAAAAAATATATKHRWRCGSCSKPLDCSKDIESIAQSRDAELGLEMRGGQKYYVSEMCNVMLLEAFAQVFEILFDQPLRNGVRQ